MSLLDGGSGGSLAWSSVGGSLRVGWVSVDVILVRDETGFNERLETVDIWDMSEAFEPLRVPRVCVDGRRGGKAGEGADRDVSVLVRDGRGGGARRAGTAVSAGGSASLLVVRRGSAGGLVVLFCGRAGMTGLGATAAATPFVWDFAAWVAEAVRLPPGGGGGGARLPVLLKFFWLFRAAMRSASELNWRSSTSAIMPIGVRGYGRSKFD